MLIRDKDSAEGYIHLCADRHKYTKKALAERLQIKLHDIAAYTLIEGKNGVDMVRIKYCPYCGVEIEKDEYEKENSK